MPSTHLHPDVAFLPWQYGDPHHDTRACSLSAFRIPRLSSSSQCHTTKHRRPPPTITSCAALASTSDAPAHAQLLDGRATSGAPWRASEPTGRSRRSSRRSVQGRALNVTLHLLCLLLFSLVSPVPRSTACEWLAGAVAVRHEDALGYMYCIRKYLKQDSRRLPLDH
jgi:hypothetical protein